MTSLPKSNEQIFVKNYYNMLCNRPSVIQQYYMGDSQLSICKELESPEVCTSDFGRYIKSKISSAVSKVLVSHLSYQRIDDLKSIISVVGQFVYVDRSQMRMSHQFVVMRVDSVLYIKNEILTFLDEEVVYECEESNKKISVIGCDWKKIPEVVGCISEFGHVKGVESRDDEVVVTLNSVEDVEGVKKNVAKLIAQGYKVEFDGLKM